MQNPASSWKSLQHHQPAEQPDPKWLARLCALSDAAVRAFGVRCFWCVPGVRDLAPFPQVKIVARQLAKYDGMRGLHMAARIEAKLRTLGESPWR
jgi:hypothetical protein